MLEGVRASIVGQRLERQLEVGKGLRIEQLAELLLAEQFAQQVAIEGKRPARRSASGASPSYMYAAT